MTQLDQLNNELRSIVWDDEPTLVRPTDHAIPEIVWASSTMFERSVDFLATSGMVIALASLVVAFVATMGAR